MGAGRRKKYWHIDISLADLSMAGNKMLIITTSKYAKVLKKYINWKIKRGLVVETIGELFYK